MITSFCLGGGGGMGGAGEGADTSPFPQFYMYALELYTQAIIKYSVHLLHV